MDRLQDFIFLFLSAQEFLTGQDPTPSAFVHYCLVGRQYFTSEIIRALDDLLNIFKITLQYDTQTRATLKSHLFQQISIKGIVKCKLVMITVT